MRIALTIFFSCALSGFALAQNPPTIREYSQSFPTYPFSDPSPVPLLTNVYPYFRYDGFTDKAIDKNWKVVELENDYIRLLILPEIGGKIWAAIEKSTGRPFLYYNHAVKFRDIAMRGPWTSGGLEANFGIIGHTPNCATPVDYITRVNEDGSVSCTIGALDLLSRSYWRMEIRLPKDKALFSTRSFWYNTTALEQPYYHWMNAGLPAGNDLEFIYPGNRYLGHNGEYAGWPVNKNNGKLISWYKNNDFGPYKSYHVFGKYTEFSGAYWHDNNLGMVRYGAHDDKAGKKIWIWGLSRQGMIWEKLLTDTDGQYVELQSGRLFNQNTPNSSRTPFQHRAFMPYGTDTWEEDWYPVLGTRGFVTANQYGALNIKMEGDWLKIYFSPVQSFRDTLTITVAGATIYKKVASFSPLQLFSDSIPFTTSSSGASPSDSLPDNLTATLGGLRYDASPTANTLSRPVDAPADFDWTTPYGNYIKGSEAMDQKNYPEAEEALRQAITKDHNYGPALTREAELLYRNMRYTEALQYATRALSINTEDGAANFIYGLINQQLGQTTDAKDGFDIASLDPAYRSVAYTCLARIYLKAKDLQRARSYAEKAMDNNRFNMEALQLQAVCARYRQQSATALTLIDALDPLNHFARFEKYLANPTPENKTQFLSLIRNELPQETFLELGIWYYSIGLSEEALKVFQLSPPCAETNLWIAHLTKKPIDWASIDPVRSFPFRAETARLLEEMIKTDDHWFLKYQLALIYKDRNRIAECKQLLQSCGDTPAFAPFYAFRAAIQAAGEDSEKSTLDLQRAALLDPQWHYRKLLTEEYIRQKEYKVALAIIAPFYRAHQDQYIMGMLYAKTLLLDRQFAAADQVLARLNIIPFEGATAGRDLYREAKLMQAVQAMQRHQYKKALEFIAAAKQWPENMGVGQPYPADEDLRLEDYMTWLCRQALHQPAASTDPKPTDPNQKDPPAKGQSETNDRILAALQSL
jgi:tetratricopeptide (TPR) repeat protein